MDKLVKEVICINDHYSVIWGLWANEVCGEDFYDNSNFQTKN